MTTRTRSPTTSRRARPACKQYDLDQALKALVKRSCACEEAPVELRTQIMARITTIRYEISE